MGKFFEKWKYENKEFYNIDTCKQMRYSKIIKVLSISWENYRYCERIWYNIKPRYCIESISIQYQCLNISIENYRTSIIISFDKIWYISIFYQNISNMLGKTLNDRYILIFYRNNFDQNRNSQAWSIYFDKISKYIDRYIKILNMIEKRYPYTLIWSIYFNNCIKIYQMLYWNPVNDREKVSIQS